MPLKLASLAIGAMETTGVKSRRPRCGRLHASTKHRKEITPLFRILLVSLILSATFPAAANQPQPFRRPLVFEPNRGQAAPQVKWITRGPGYQLFFTGDGVTMMVQESAAGAPKSDRLSGPIPAQQSRPETSKQKYSTVRMKLDGSRPWNNVTGLEPTGGVSNYLSGKDRTAWRTDIPHYAKISAAGVYDGIDLVFYTNGADLEYDFVVRPGADPNQIRFAFEGTERMRVDDKTGDLVLTTAGGSELRQVRPKVYQQVGDRRIEAAGGYELLDRGRAAFTLAAYDQRRPLVIDPTVSFTKFLAGNSSDDAFAIAVDSDGNSYVTGSTKSTNFPISNDSSYQECSHDLFGFCTAGDGFVTKLDPNGGILFSTYFGAGVGAGIAVDSTGVVVAGNVVPTDNVVGLAGRADAYVIKLSLTGSFLFARHYGGENDDTATAVALDLNMQPGWRAIPVLTASPEGA
jgi:Beta-propeller repeat